MVVSHKNIKKFNIDGEIYDEAAIPNIKEQYINILKTIMQGKGYVIRYDMILTQTLRFSIMERHLTFYYRYTGFS
jgi:hypothetical protein